MPDSNPEANKSHSNCINLMFFIFPCFSLHQCASCCPSPTLSLATTRWPTRPPPLSRTPQGPASTPPACWPAALLFSPAPTPPPFSAMPAAGWWLCPVPRHPPQHRQQQQLQRQQQQQQQQQQRKQMHQLQRQRMRLPLPAGDVKQRQPPQQLIKRS